VSGAAPFLRYDAWTLEDGRIMVDASTNDNRDFGYVSEDASWTFGPMTPATFAAVCGVCRVGCSGILVTVTLDGQYVDRARKA
jgi:hypothetical protein